jgi:serine/threonine protein kinase
MTKPLPFGKYLLLDRLNVGGMAEVYLAKVFGHQGGDRIVALKRILPSLLADQEFVGMFIDEARIAVQLDHRNLIQIFELGRQEDNYYIAMEYVSGCDLRTIIDRSKKRSQPLSIAHAIYVIGELAAGLDHAHRARDRSGDSLEIVHRDVSPQNIVVSRDGRIKLIDFGIAKAATGQPATQVGILKGKFGYMSPEQARGQPIDRRSDVFALGIIFYELLTGLRLFAGEADFAVLERVRRAEIVPPRRANPAIPQEIERIVLKALAREPDDRYAWASEVAEDLRSFLGFDAGDLESRAMAHWLQLVLAEELRREEERMRAFDEIQRPAEMPTVPLESFMITRRGPTTGENQTRVLPGSALTPDFDLAQTSLMSSLPSGFPSARSQTDVLDRWDDSTRPPLPIGAWPEQQPSDPALPRPVSSRVRSTLEPIPLERRTLVWLALGLLMTGALVTAGVWARLIFPSTGALVVMAHPFVDLTVELDNQPVVLSKEGIGVIRDLRPGTHFLLAKGPVERQARWVTVVANEVATVDLVFKAPPIPAPPAPALAPALAHNRE